MAPIARENATSDSGILPLTPLPRSITNSHPLRPTRMYAFQIRFITAKVGRRTLRALACLFTSQYVNTSSYICASRSSFALMLTVGRFGRKLDRDFPSAWPISYIKTDLSIFLWNIRFFVEAF